MLRAQTVELAENSMRNLATAPAGEFKGVRFVLTDMDETLTYKGRLSAQVYLTLEQLRAAGLRVIVVTAAPAGWCDQMARMWPVDGVIGENGGLYYCRDGENGLSRRLWHDRYQREHLAEIGMRITAKVPGAVFAPDQQFRLATLAFARPGDDGTRLAILSALKDAGLNATQNNLWLLGWIGDFNKLAMARRVLDHVAEDAICYLGDSENDAPMFATFRHSIGMSTVREHRLSSHPRWVTNGPGGAGFVEAAKIILASIR